MALAKDPGNSHISRQFTGGFDGVVHQRLPMERRVPAVGFVMMSVFDVDVDQFQRGFQCPRHSDGIDDHGFAVGGSAERSHHRLASAVGIPHNQKGARRVPGEVKANGTRQLANNAA